MKSEQKRLTVFVWIIALASLLIPTIEVSAQCDPNYIYGLTNMGMIQKIDVTTGTVDAPINPAYSGATASLSNAMGYNPLNGQYYFFQRNTLYAPQQFLSFDPATNLYTPLASSPVGTNNLVNLGCINSTGLGYYCLDAFGSLYYYDISLDQWSTICSNIKDQFGNSLSSIIGTGSLNRFYGDISFDGNGNLWLVISGPADYGVYEITGPLPTTNVSNLTATEIIPPTTPSPGGTFGGMAFSASGTMYMSSNSPNNVLYELTSLNTLVFVANMSGDGIGNDLTSCNFPLGVLASNWVKLSASVVDDNTVKLNWSILQPDNCTGYEIQTSRDGINWDDLHFSQKIAAALPTKYTYSQPDAPAGVQYYRLRKSDKTGTIAYSGIVKVNPTARVSISLWPNPVHDLLKLQSNDVSLARSQAYIYDASGKMVSTLNLNASINDIQVNNLHSGTYLLHVILSNGQAINRKFVKN